MKVLVIAYYFPPFGGGASERFHYFVKYLPACGITPLVLTVDEACYEDIYRDQNRVDEYSSEVRLYRSSVIFGDILKRQKSQAMAGESGYGAGASIKRTLKRFVKNLIVPDEQVFWVPRAIAKARQIFKDHDIRAIVATAPPFSGHLVGAVLSRRYGVPLLLDYRDLWHRNPSMLGNGLRAVLNGIIERLALARATAVLCTNQAAADVLNGHYGLAPCKVHVVENGFDAQKIESVMRAIPNERTTGKIRITYLGSLTKERTPRYFLAAFKRFVTDYPQYDLEVGFVGYTPAEHLQLVNEMGLSDRVRFHGTVSKEVALDMMCNRSEVLLLLQRSSEGGATAIPGKLYEYLAAGKPLLCMDEGHGITSHFLEELGITSSVEYRDEDGIYTALLHVVRHYDAVYGEFGTLRDRIAVYDRKQLTQRLAEVIIRLAR